MVKLGDAEGQLINDYDFKNNIIDYLFNTIDISKYRYNLLENITQLNFLKLNEHYISPNFKGSNYFAIFNKYNNIPYCAFIDKKNLSYHREKIDIKKIPIFKVKINTSPSIFRGTIIDCKLNKNIMIIKDCFQMMGNMIIDMDMCEKMLYIDSIIIEQFQKNYSNNFTFKINKLYKNNMLHELITNIIPKCSIDIQGLIFLPKQSGVSIIFIDKNTQIVDIKSDASNASNISNTSNTSNTSYHIIHDLKNFLLSRTYAYELTGVKKNLMVERTDIMDVYNVYENTNKLGIAHIPNMKISQYCNENIKEKELCQCVFYNNFNKWIPLKLI